MKRKLIVGSSIYIVCVILCFLYVYERPVVIVEKGQLMDGYLAVAYSDTGKTVASESALYEDPHALRLVYTHGDATWPYTGVMLYKNDSSYIDIEDYDYLRVVAEAEQGERLPVYIFTDTLGFGSWEDPNSFINLHTNLTVKGASKNNDIGLDEFTIPNWWFWRNNIENDDRITGDFSKTVMVNIASDPSVDNGIQDNLFITDVSICKSYGLFWMITGIITLLLTGSVFILKFRGKKTEEAIVADLDYKPLEVKGYKERDTEVVLQFILDNYSKRDMTVEWVKDAVGISERKIAQIVKDEKNCNFKQYVNELRINQAKAILTTTQRAISDVADDCGYNSVSHFNRVFKTVTGCSPSEYRNNQNREVETVDLP